MTPKEKAIELRKKFFEPVRWKLGQENVKQRAKECALITVDEILEEVSESADNEVKTARIIYWRSVKQQIQEL